MQRPSVNYLIDLLTLVGAMAIACTGLIMRFALPPGSGRSGQVLWGLGRHEWGSVHFWLTVSVAGLLAIHLFLHWAWVCTVTSRLMHPRARVHPPPPAVRRRMGAAFVVGLAAILVGFTMVARSSVGQDEGAVEQHQGLNGAGLGEPVRAGRTRAP